MVDQNHSQKTPVASPVRFALEAGKLAELARSLHEEDPAWTDPEAAAAAGFAAVPAPPTATVLADHWRPAGPLTHAEAAGMDVARLLHGEVNWTFHRPLRLGDELIATSSVVDRQTRRGKRGGAMTFLTVETAFTDPEGNPVATCRDTYIETEVPS